MIETIRLSTRQFLESLGVGTESLNTITQITLLLGLLICAALTEYICRRVVAPIVMKIVNKSHTKWDDYLLDPQMIRALCRIVPGLFFYIVLPICTFKETPLFTTILTQGAKIYITVTFISLLTTFYNNVETLTQNEDKFRSKRFFGIVEFLKIGTYFVGAIIIIAFLLSQNPLSMIAGIGAAATVLIFIFKDFILGLVAGIQLSSNQMLKPGDWITVKKLNIDGTVEQISLTTVKVRNFDNTISTVPPYTLISETFQNWAPMFDKGSRRIKRVLYIDVTSIGFCSADTIQTLANTLSFFNSENIEEEKNKVNLTLFREYSEHYIKNLPHTDNGHFSLVRQLSHTPYGLPLEVWFYSTTTAFTQYEARASECIEHLISVLPLFGLRLFQGIANNDFKNPSEQ